MARVVSKFKTTTIVYSILQKSAAKIGHSTHIFRCSVFIARGGGGGGVVGISSDGDDGMEPKVKTQKNPWTKN